MFIEGNDELVLQKTNKRNATKINNDKKSKRNIRPDMAFKNLTPSQKSFFKQKSLPIVSNDLFKYICLNNNNNYYY